MITIAGRAEGGAGDDIIQAAASDFAGLEATGGTGNDTLSGADRADTLDGGDGADIINGGGGADVLTGGAGDDTISGGAGADTASYIGTVAVSVNLAVTAAQDTGGAGVDTLRSIENLIGSSSPDVLTGSASNNVLDGGLGGTEFDPGQGDVLTGGAGNDTYVVNNIADLVIENGDEGVDLVISRASYTLPANVENLTLVFGYKVDGNGNDLDNRITGNEQDNVLRGGGGDDTMRGGAGNDVYVVDRYDDQAIEDSSHGTDAVFASADYKLSNNVEKLTLTGSSDLWAYGNDGANTVSGNAGANKLYGMGGDDALLGNDGNDWLEGGAGQDRLFGGTGHDSFVFRDGDFGGATTATCDQIKDFSQADGDQIRLNFVDADTTLGGNQAFAFVGTAAFDGQAGELRYEQVSGNTYLSGDTNGDGIADFMIRLDGFHTLASSDFSL